jgi:cytochrome c5
MRTNTFVWRLIIALTVAGGLLVACGGPTSPEATEPPGEVQPTAAPTEAPQGEAPTLQPTEAPAEEAPTAQPPAGDGAALLEERCTDCHGLDRTTSARKTREEWEQTVVRMVGKGAQLTKDEQAVLIDYLTATYGP